MAVSKVTLNGSTLMDTTGVTVDESNLLTGNTALDNSGTLITGMATAENDFIVTLSYNDQTEMWEPDCTFAELQAAFTAEKMVSAIVDGDNLGEAATVSWDSQLQEAYIIVYYWKDLSVEEWCMINANYYWNANDGYVLNNEENLPRITFETISKTYTPTLSQQTETIVPDSSLGYNGIDQVNITVNAMPSGTAGTPTATKGSVSNNSISVTPSVTNTTGYITGSTISGTAVTVSASELDSGTKSIAENGTGIDVVGYAAVDVAVPAAPQYTAKITGNCTTAGGYAEYKNTMYRSDTEFTFSPGETCYLSITGRMTTEGIYVDGVLVASGVIATYTYTLPSHSIEIYMYSGSSGRINVTPLTLEITSNGEYDVTGYAVADVELPAGTEGTPVATKGTVSNHSISVTPSVTNTAGVITGGTHTGTPVTVDVTELESGTKAITENGTGISVSGYSAIDVNVSGGGGGNDFIVTLSKVNGVWTPDCTFAEIQSAFNTGKTIAAKTDDFSYIADGLYDDYDDAFYYSVDSFDYTTNGYTTQWYIYDSNGITDDGNVIYYQTSNADAVPSDVAQGKVFYNANGYQTGTSTAITPTGSITITQNGTVNVSEYAVADVNVSGGGGVTVESLSVTQNGTYTAPTGKAYTPVTVNVSGGGSSANKIRFIDYDGTVLHEYTPAQYAQLSALPANPSHTGLVAQGWNWTKQQIDDYLEDYPNGDVNVGQMYITASGKTEIDVRFEDPNFLSPYLMLAVNGEVSVDWGDSSSSDTVTGSSLTTSIFTQHTYSSTGNYTIKITSVSGSYTFYCSSSNYSAVLSVNNIADYNRSYSTCVTGIRLGNGVTSIGGGAFEYCYALASVTIPDGVTSIGSYAFQYCCAITSVTIPDGVTSIGSSTFAGCYSLTSITIPDTVTSIGGSAFQNCYSLTSITIPDGVTSISSSAFYSCYALASLTIPDTVTSIGGSAFNGCYSLTSITIPDGVTSIGSNAFQNCYSLTSITIPDGVTSISSSAFCNCYALASLTIPDTVTSIGGSAFQNCYSLTSITIPSGCTVGRSAFRGCALFTSLPVPLPNDATDIKASEFENCYSLTSITIPNTVTAINNYAFRYCYSLTSVTIPDGVTSIGSNAFQNCYSLVSLTIPDTVTSIGNSAFGVCYSMKEYHFQRTTPPTLGGSSVFGSIPSDCIIYVPYSADHSVLNAYKTASNWSSQASKMQEEPQS